MLLCRHAAGGPHIAFQFLPSVEQARAHDARMRLLLSESLLHIREQAVGHIDFDFARLDPLIAGLREARRYPCTTFALFADLVPALETGDVALAQALLQQLANEAPLRQGWRILPLDHCSHRAHRERLVRLMDTDPDAHFTMRAPPPDVAAAFTERLVAAHSLLSSATPELAGEFDVLVSDIVMVVGDSESEHQFDGGSSYMLWGGLFLNATSHQGRVALGEVMAHESAHLLLYGCAADEALVENPDDELFSSPLRVDPRPMDGIFHATFVSARMHWAMKQLLQNASLLPQERMAAQAAMERDARSFWEGYAVVERHGSLTHTGREVMAAVAAYMAAAAPANSASE